MGNSIPYITCPCGLSRALPPDVKEGVQFSLKPCPVCQQPFEGVLIGNKVYVP